MKREGFILASNLLALGIISLAIAFFLVNYQCYRSQRVEMDEQLEAARLCQEAADEVSIKGGSVQLHRHNLVVNGNEQKIVVKKGRREVITLWRM